RLLEEYYKILRAGSSEKAFRGLAEVGLLPPISKELHHGAAEPLWQSLSALDGYRRQFESTPDTLSNAILLGTLLVPLGISLTPPRGQYAAAADGANGDRKPKRTPGPRLGELPLARRDIERLRQIVGLQRRMRDLTASPKAQRALAHRATFREAWTWLEIHGGTPELVEHWKAILSDGVAATEAPAERVEGAPITFERRRRRRRRRRRHVPTPG